MNAARTCVLYARKSTNRDDKQVLSTPSQISELRKFAAQTGLTITAELTESASARRPGRPVFAKLTKDIERGRVERVLTWKPDRLARNPVDGGALIYFLGEKILKEIVTPERTFDCSADSKFMLLLDFGLATKMVDELAKNVQRGNREVLARGRIPWRAPRGYTKLRDRPGRRGAGRAIHDPKVGPTVLRVWKTMLTGTVTVSELWRQATHDWGLRISVSQLYALLRNPFYSGIIVTNSGTFQGDHEPMVTPEEFRRVQELIRPTDAPRPKRHSFAYAGLLHCGRCGRLFIGERHEKSSGLVFTYYRCGRRHQGKEICRAPGVREEAVHTDIDQALGMLVLPENLAAWTHEAIDYAAQQERDRVVERMRALEHELRTLEQRRDRLTRLVVAGTLRDDEFIRERDVTEGRIAQVQRAIQEPAAEFAGWRTNVAKVLAAGCRIAEIVTSTDAGVRKAFVSEACANLIVEERNTKLCLRFPFTLLENAAATSRALSESCANPLPTPETVLSQPKNAHAHDECESALSDWWTKVEEVRTQGAKLAAHEAARPKKVHTWKTSSSTTPVLRFRSSAGLGRLRIRQLLQ